MKHRPRSPEQDDLLRPRLRDRIIAKLALVSQLLHQQPKGADKIYALYEPAVDCISKGEARVYPAQTSANTRRFLRDLKRAALMNLTARVLTDNASSSPSGPATEAPASRSHAV
jgi:hypothetical protein